MSGCPLLTPSYLFNVSFALVTIQISSSFSILYQRHLPILLVSSLIIEKAMFNNDDPTVTVCPNRKHAFPAKDYIVIASNTVASLFRMLLRCNYIFFSTMYFFHEFFLRSSRRSQYTFDPYDYPNLSAKIYTSVGICES